MVIEAETEAKNEQFKNGWEQTRAIVHTLAAVNGAKESANQLMPFPWDKKVRKTAPKLTKKESDALEDFVSKLNKQTNGISGT